MKTPDLSKYQGGTAERVGFILPGGVIVECKNISPKPEVSFEVSGEDLIRYADSAVATWHTHPDTDNNLSVDDYEMFLAWHTLEHFIVGTNGTRRYVIEDGEVLIA